MAKRKRTEVPAALEQAVARAAKKIEGQYCFGLPNYDLDAKLKISLVELGDLTLFEKNEIENPEGWLPFAKLKGEMQFLAVSTHVPWGVGGWEHEDGQIHPVWKSLDDFVASLLGQKEPTPYAALKDTLDQAWKLIEADRDAEGMALLEPWVDRLPPRVWLDRSIAQFHNLYGLGLKAAGKASAARASFEKAVAAGDVSAELNVLRIEFELLEPPACLLYSLSSLVGVAQLPQRVTRASQ